MDKNLLLSARFPHSLRVIHQPCTVSTNLDARKLIESGSTTPILVTADTQTGGRGRQGKTFLSPEGGLYMTLAYPTNAPLDRVVSVTSAAAVGVCRALSRASGANCGIKWVNDIYYGHRKLAGILVESVNDYTVMESRWLIIGVGVNLTHTPDVDHLGGVQAASLQEEGFACSPEDLCSEIVGELLAFRDSGYRFDGCIDEYRRRSVVLGREITFERNGEHCCGTAKAIGSNGELMVETDDGMVVLSSGEISVRVKRC